MIDADSARRYSQGPRSGEGEFATLGLRLIKVAARVVETASRVRLAFAGGCPARSARERRAVRPSSVRPLQRVINSTDLSR